MKTLPFAPLKHVTDFDENRMPYCTHRVETPAEAVALVARATRVFAIVLLTPERQDWFQVPREEALARLQRLPNDAKVICTRDNDGWCWIGQPAGRAMKDADIIAALQRSSAPAMTAVELANQLGAQPETIISRLSKLYLYGKIDRMKIAPGITGGRRYAYQAKRPS